MFRGNTETFRIRTLQAGANDDVTISAPNGILNLSASGVVRVRILNAGAVGSVGIGDMAPGFVPAATLHLNAAGGFNFNNPQLRFTNPFTPNGFVIQQLGQEVMFRQLENAPVLFFTPGAGPIGTERLRLDPNGNAGFGDFTNATNVPVSSLHVLSGGSETFRTETGSGIQHWRMMQNTTVVGDISAQNGNLHIDAPSGDLHLQALGLRHATVGTGILPLNSDFTSRVMIHTQPNNPITNPVANLHIGQRAPDGGGGSRG